MTSRKLSQISRTLGDVGLYRDYSRANGKENGNYYLGFRVWGLYTCGVEGLRVWGFWIYALICLCPKTDAGTDSAFRLLNQVR